MRHNHTTRKRRISKQRTSLNTSDAIAPLNASHGNHMEAAEGLGFWGSAPLQLFPEITSGNMVVLHKGSRRISVLAILMALLATLVAAAA